MFRGISMLKQVLRLFCLSPLSLRRFPRFLCLRKASEDCLVERAKKYVCIIYMVDALLEVKNCRALKKVLSPKMCEPFVDRYNELRYCSV